MRIALDLRWWQESHATSRPNGIATYSRGLVQALLARPGPDQYVFVLSNGIPDPPELVPLLRNDRAGVIRAPRTWLARGGSFTVGVLHHLARERRVTGHLPGTEELDVWHAPSHFIPPPPDLPCATVTTIHDLIYLHRPQDAFRTPFARLVFDRLLARARRSTTLLAVSAFAAEDIRTRLGVPSSRIVVALPGVDPAPADTGAPPEADGPFFLHVGGTTPTKNVEGLIEGYARFRARIGPTAPSLRLAGDPGEGERGHHLRERISAPDLAGHVRFEGYVTPARLEALYRGALALVYPSRMEGFGLPVLEAMARGVPVVTSRSGPLPEVAGDAAILVDAEDPEALARALAEVHGSEERRRTMADEGRRRAASFSWARTAAAARSAYLAAAAPDLVRTPPGIASYWTRYYASSRARAHIGTRRRREMLRTAGVLQGQRVLDVGCGAGQTSSALALAGGDVIGMDLDRDLVQAGPAIAAASGTSARFLLADATRLPVRQAGFDCVFSMEMLEHVPAWEAALAEMGRALASGGRIVISTPNKWGFHHMLKMAWTRLGLFPDGYILYEHLLSRREILGALARHGLRAEPPRTLLFMMPFVPDALFPLALALERVLEHIPVVRDLGVTTIYAARRPGEAP